MFRLLMLFRNVSSNWYSSNYMTFYTGSIYMYLISCTFSRSVSVCFMHLLKSIEFVNCIFKARENGQKINQDFIGIFLFLFSKYV